MSREYPCVYYDNGKCRKFEEPGYVDYCVLGPCSHQTPSNADRIRAMSDGELAKFLAETYVRGSCSRLFHTGVEPTEIQKKAAEHTGGHNYFNWLKQPAEEVEHE